MIGLVGAWLDSTPCLFISSQVKRSDLITSRGVWIKLPYGEFAISPVSDACLLAGGIGITAFTAFIAGLPTEYGHHAHLFYGAHCPELLIYRSLIETTLERCSNLHSIFMAEQSADGINACPGDSIATLYGIHPRSIGRYLLHRRPARNDPHLLAGIESTRCTEYPNCD